LPRAIETAQPIAELLHLEVELLPEFREMNNGVLAGMPNEQADREYPNARWSQLGWDEHYPNGESPHEFVRRITQAWKRFAQLHLDEDVILVSHAGVMRIIFAELRQEAYNNQRSERLDFPYVAIVPVELGRGNELKNISKRK
jgi:probable phosphoglycerate mutase